MASGYRITVEDRSTGHSETFNLTRGKRRTPALKGMKSKAKKKYCPPGKKKLTARKFPDRPSKRTTRRPVNGRTGGLKALALNTDWFTN